VSHNTYTESAEFVAYYDKPSRTSINAALTAVLALLKGGILATATLALFHSLAVAMSALLALHL